MIRHPNLVAEWRFEGNANDSSGNGNNLSVTSCTLDTGRFGKGYHWDGVNDFMEAASTLIPIAGDFTIAAHFRIHAWTSFVDGTGATCYGNTIMAQYGARYGLPLTTKDGRFIFFANNSNTQKLEFLHGGGAGLVTGTTTLSLDTWYWGAISRIGNDFFLYLDGKQEATAASAIGIEDIATKLGIACPLGGSGGEHAYDYLQSGIMDEGYIYNKGFALPDVKRIMLGLHPLN